MTEPPGSPDPTPWLDDDQQADWRAYLRGSRLLERALGEDLAPLGIQLAEYELVSMLSEAPEQTLRMSQLAELVVQSRSRVTHTASRLERRGWVERSPAEGDGRGVQIRLTEAGAAMLDQVAGIHVRSVRRHLVDTLTPEQLAGLGDAMATVRRRLAPDHRELGEDG